MRKVIMMVAYLIAGINMSPRLIPVNRSTLILMTLIR